MSNLTSAELKSKFYYGYVMALLGFMVIFIALVLKNNVSSLFVVPITKELGITRTAFIFNLSIMAVTMMVSCFFMGAIITRFKLKNVMAICFLVLSISYVAFSQVTALWQIYVIAAVMGAAFAGATTLPVNIMINNWFGMKVKGTMQSVASLGSGVGAIIWVNVFQYILSHYGWRVANLAIAAVFFFIMIPLVYFIAVDRPEERGYARRLGDPVTGEAEVSAAKLGIDIKQIWRMKRFWLQSVGQVLIVACSAGAYSQIVPYFTDLGMSATAAAALYSGAMGSLMFGKIILGFIADIIKVPRASLLSPVFFSLAFISLFLMASGTPSWLFLVTFFIGGSVSTIIPPILTAKNYGDKDFGSIMGIVTMEGNIGQIIGPLLGAFVFDTTGSYKNAWIIYACVALVVGVCWYISTKLSKKQAADFGYE